MEDDDLVMGLIFSPIHQRYRAASRGFGNLFQAFAVFQQFFPVALLEFGPLTGIVAKPLSKLR